jgi:hypothetical protein
LSLIILQLKSTQEESALVDINKTISQLKNKRGYKIRGHEIHQIRRNLERRTWRERALMVSSFCSRNEIEYLTYHVPVSRNEGRGLIDERSYEQADDSILATLNEVEMVYEETGFKDKVVIVHHLPSVIGSEEIPHLDSDQKFQILENAERHLLDFYRRNSNYFSSIAILTLENVFPKYFTNKENYATINMFHPIEMIRLREHGIGVTFDLSHYNIYSNYLSYGEGNRVGDLDRQIYGATAPTWNECIDLFGDSLFQLHISGGKGADSSGEGLIFTDGEVPVIAILTYIKYCIFSNEQVRYARSHNARDDRVIRATIELREGHLYGGKLQRTAVEWLLTHAENLFY